MPQDILKPIRNRAVDDDAAAAISGLPIHPDSDLASKLDALERLREAEKQKVFRSDEAKVLRAEVAVLALSWAELKNSTDATVTQSGELPEYKKLIGSMIEIAQFAAWFREKYPTEWVDGAGKTLLQVVRGVMETRCK